MFKDYGYRLMPCFGQSFDLGKPILVEEHLCPVGLSEPPKSITDYISQRKEGRHGERVVVNDRWVVGAESLLEIADEEGDDAILLTGVAKGDGRYICMDLLQDHVEPDELHLSCDVDSIIWVTQTPKFKGPVAIYSVPVVRDRAPIWKDNHVQIQVLHPQTEKDKLAIGGRKEWMATSQSLSTIPHLLFGAVQGSSVAEILIFFPRMMHRDPHRRFRVNRIPKGIQDFFWDRVILPALQSVIPSTRSAYLPIDRSHTAFKMGNGKHSATFSMDPEDMERLIEVMRAIVSNLPSVKETKLDTFEMTTGQSRQPETVWVVLFHGADQRIQICCPCAEGRPGEEHAGVAEEVQIIIFFVGLEVHDGPGKGGADL